jgi:excisionase family DNA binding protein
MSADATDRWLDVRGASARSLTSDSTILRAARSGKLVGFKVNGNRCWRFRASAVDAWIESGSREAQEQQHHIRIANR